jgi:glycosyltransferase involved in cell wall biosynthesis
MKRIDEPTVVSIVINNYNYGCFLRDAIESALGQTYAHVEVIVVDDGSTDDSREIIAGYGSRVIPVLKENGGQASAFNTGFEQCRGELVIFLDSDDMLLPHVVTDVVDAYDQNPKASKIQYRLEFITADGTPTGKFMPPAQLAMPNGDLRRHSIRFPDDIRTPATSGNAFSRRALQRIMPMPEHDLGNVGADLYLFNLTPLFGHVVSLTAPGGYYRVHGSNNFYASELSLTRVRETITRTAVNHGHIKRYADIIHLPRVPDHCEDILSVTYLVNRIASFKLEPELHPFEGDSVVGLTRLGIKSAARRFDLALRIRSLYMVWFVAAACSPRPVTRWLVTKVFYPEQRGLLGRLVQ